MTLDQFQRKHEAFESNEIDETNEAEAIQNQTTSTATIEPDNSSSQIDSTNDNSQKAYNDELHKQPRFPPEIWTVFERVKNNISKTNNSLEASHGSMQVIFVYLIEINVVSFSAA